MILLLQPGWCDFAWAYANQALLSGDWKLCVDDLNLNLRDEFGGNVCQPTTAFNEFSTLDLHLPPGTTLNLHAWLRVGEGDVEGSDTYFSYEVKGPTEGLKISTVTHGGGAASQDGLEDSPPDMHDYRLFRPGDTLTLPLTGGGSLTAELWRPYSLQVSVATLCFSSGLDHPGCSGLANRAAAHALTLGSLSRFGLPLIQALPSVATPFVFLHHEKTSGSTLRSHIASTAHSISAPFYLPCYYGDGLYYEDYRCYSFDTSNATEENGGRRGELAVMGGHFQWGEWEDYQDPRCLVMVRDPVERAISLYYERVYTREDHLGGRMLNELTREEWRFILEEWRGSAWGMYRDEGFKDSMCKMLLGESHFRGKRPEEVDWERVGRMRLDGGEAMKRMGKCVVGMQGEWEDTKRVIWRWFPWLKFEDKVRANTGRGSGAERKADVREELVEELMEVNRCDMEVWEFSQTRFKEQVEWMDGVGRGYV
ncbi:hypothetical protein TrCOL_g5034 [Triparma columacea]|uniref:Sulfotransferase n=1 Tax=Triparma columacea TaxID=722753 RepID=A0A9W7GAE9_9STRA|nr:hypothetical protein TrCOL_g5034 [Triparma columacea]